MNRGSLVQSPSAGVGRLLLLKLRAMHPQRRLPPGYCAARWNDPIRQPSSPPAAPVVLTVDSARRDASPRALHLAFNPEQLLDMVSDLMCQDVRLREVAWRAKALL